jgi:hypothetical protein
LKRKTVRKKISSKIFSLKRGAFSIEFESFFRNQIEGLLIVSSWSEQFRAGIGLKGVSQVWVGPPAWYFWLEHAPGVYHLELLEAEGEMLKGAGLCKAVFVIKCYPYQDDDCFHAYSFLERKLIQSRFFDSTNTPVFEYRQKIPPDLFTVAVMELTMDHQAHRALFCIETQDVLANRYAQEADQFFAIVNLNQHFARNEIDRKIRGLEISYPFFDCLLCLYAHAHKQTPLQIQFSRLPGNETVINRATATVQRSDGTNAYKIGVLYAASDHRHAIDLIDGPRIFMEPREEVIYAWRFECGQYHGDYVGNVLPVSINEQWWSLAHARFESDLASTCGHR